MLLGSYIYISTVKKTSVKIRSHTYALLSGTNLLAVLLHFIAVCQIQYWYIILELTLELGLVRKTSFSPHFTNCSVKYAMVWGWCAFPMRGVTMVIAV